ncbi:MAG: cysteine hydrolase family protein [Terriglobales bacterium]
MASIPDAQHDQARLFWDVDTQVDFMLPEGKLYARGAEQILPRLMELTQYARKQRILVVASMDAHHSDDPEFNQWPLHCLVGTPGQEKVKETKLDTACVIRNVPTEIPQDLSHFEQVILEKQAVDVFTNPNTEALLQRLGRREVTLYGVVTEVCVGLAARGLLDRGYKVRVVTDAIRALDEESGKKALDELARRGAELVSTSEVVRRAA